MTDRIDYGTHVDEVFVSGPTTDVGEIERAIASALACDEVGCHGDRQPAPNAGERTKATLTQHVRAALDGEHQVMEFRCSTHDGATFVADVRILPVAIDDDTRLVVLISNRTALDALEGDRAAFEKAVEQAGHSIYITDADGVIEYVNPAFESVTGYRAEEVIGEEPSILKSDEHTEAFYRELWETILAGEVWRSELVNRRKDGSQYVVNQTIAPITDETGTIRRFVAVNAEITEEVKRNRQLQLLYEATTEWLNAESKPAVYELVSEQLVELLEFDLHGFCLYDEERGSLRPTVTSDRADVDLEDHPEFEEGEGIVWTVFETGEVRAYDDVRTDPAVYNPETEIRSELVLPLGDHGVLLIGSHTVGAFDEVDVAITKVLTSTLTEVLNRIDREDALAEQNSRLHEFASVVSHDLRNPLSVASGHLELAMESGDEAHLEEVAQAHERMTEIIEDLLWLAREGQAIKSTKPVSLGRIVEAAWAVVDTNEATITIDADRVVEADPDRLQQLFENLFRNAVEHAGPSPTVRVSSLEDGFFVADDGPGIGPADRERVFEAGVTSVATGTGYGLSIVDTIATAHGWDVTVSESEDGGARFEFTGVSMVGE